MAVEQERLSSVGWAPPWVRHEHMARYLFARDLVRGCSVVDCACGDGTSSRLLADGAEHVWGFDVSEAAIAHARAANAVANVEYAVRDATALSLDAGAATAYVSLETIEHLQDPEAFLNEVVRVLDADGVFICSTPDREVYSPGNGPADRPWNQFHVKEFSEPEFVAMLSRFFGQVDLYGQNRKTRFVTAAKHRAGALFPAHAVIRLNQVLKLPRLVHDRLERHLVEPAAEGSRYEYLIAVCRTPRPSARSSGGQRAGVGA